MRSFQSWNGAAASWTSTVSSQGFSRGGWEKCPWMATKRPDDTASPSGLELLEARQELPPAPAGNDDEPGGIDEVPSAVHGRVHADLAVRGNDVEPVDDDAPQPRALAHRGVIHDA